MKSRTCPLLALAFLSLTTSCMTPEQSQAADRSFNFLGRVVNAYRNVKDAVDGKDQQVQAQAQPQPAAPAPVVINIGTPAR